MKDIKSMPLIDGLTKLTVKSGKGKTKNLFSFGSLISTLDNTPSALKTSKQERRSFFFPFNSKISGQKSPTDVKHKSTASEKPIKTGTLIDLAKLIKTTRPKNSDPKKQPISTETEAGIIAALNIMDATQTGLKKLPDGTKELSDKVSLSYKKTSGMQLVLKDPKQVQPAQEYLKELRDVAQKKAIKIPGIKISAFGAVKQEEAIASKPVVESKRQAVQNEPKGKQEIINPVNFSKKTKQAPLETDTTKRHTEPVNSDSKTTHASLKAGSAQNHAEPVKAVPDPIMRAAAKEPVHHQDILKDKKIQVSVKREEIQIPKSGKAKNTPLNHKAEPVEESTAMRNKNTTHPSKMESAQQNSATQKEELNIQQPVGKIAEVKPVNELQQQTHPVQGSDFKTEGLPAKYMPMIDRIHEMIRKYEKPQTDNAVRTSFKIETSPAGKLEIKFSEIGPEKQVQIIVENEIARNDMQKLIPQIQQSLALKGIEFSLFSIDVGGYNSKSDQAAVDKKSQNRNRQQNVKEVDDDSDPTVLNHKNYGYNTMELIA